MKSNQIFTSEQELAMRTDRHISVTANAGSGKTMVLVERFRKIINEKIINDETNLKNPLRIDPSRILAITFTRKAAGEMQKKIVQKFQEEYLDLLHSEKKDYNKLNTFKRIREGLSYSNISTIHGFCSSLLRNFPIEADVPVNFNELSAVENLHLTNDCFMSTMEDWLNEGQNNDENNYLLKIKTLLKYFTRSELLSAVSLVIEKAEIHKALQIFYNKTDSELKDEALEFILESFDFDIISSDFLQLIKFIKASDFFNIKSKSDSAKNLMELKSLASEFRDTKATGIDSLNIEEIKYQLSYYVSIVKILYTQGMKLRDTSKKNINSRYLQFLDELVENCINLMKLNDAVASFEYFDQTMQVSRYLWEFISDVYQLLDSEKKNENRLDFNDLQLKAYKLLTIPEFAEKVRNDYDYIMIDEFQDTNDLQYDIVRALVPELQNPGSGSGINLFIVGDAKQSIYGFRNADVRVFNKAIEDIVNINKRMLDDNKIPLKPEHIITYDRKFNDYEFIGRNKLTSTFRLLPAPAAFINIIFRSLMGDKQSGFDVDYSDLICSRNTDKIDVVDNLIQNNEKIGEVVFLLSEVDKNDDDQTENEENVSENQDISEEKQIADYIKSILGRTLNSSSNEEKINYKDIAILCHKKTNFAKLSKVLHAAKIPHIINGGHGFYKTEEVDDLINVLRFIYNPNDDLAFAALIRSPFMNFNDTDIFKIQQSSTLNSLWEKFAFVAKNQRWTKVINSYKSLEDIRNYSVSQPITTVIYKILQIFGWVGKMAYSPAKDQKLANIDKFIDLARDYEELGFKNIFDFIDEVNFIADNSVRESEAPVITDENAINILTIHSAKGLQFPVVILYNTNSGSRKTGSMAVTSTFGIAFKLNAPDDNYFENKVNTPFEIINKLINRQMEEAEAKRVLYVAMTRAEEILAISGLVYKDKNDNYKLPVSYLKMICLGLNITLESFMDDGYNSITKLGIRRNNIIEEVDINVTAVNIREIINTETAVPLTTIDNNVSFLTGDVVAKQINETFSASKIMTFDKSVEEYFFRYILGFTDDENELIHDSVISEDEEPVGIYPGKAIHSSLENFNNWISPDNVIDDKLLKNVICSVLGVPSFDSDDKLQKRILSECCMVAKTKLFKKEMNNIRTGEFEKQMIIPVGDNFLKGVIDIFFKNSNGDYEIWDWKTNLLNDISDTIELIKYYEIQMKVYAYLASKLVPEQDIFTARLLFTRLADVDIPDNRWTQTFTWSKHELDKFSFDFETKISEIRNRLYFWL